MFEGQNRVQVGKNFIFFDSNFQPLLECQSDDLPLTVHTPCLSL